MSKELIIVTAVLLGSALQTQNATMVDELFGEALLNSIQPELKQKLEQIYEIGLTKNYSMKKMMKFLQQRLSSEEVQALEKAYRRLLLPVIQSTLESKLRRPISNIDDVPMNMFDVESDEEIIGDDGDLILNSIGSAENGSSGDKRKKKKKTRRNSPRPMGSMTHAEMSGEGKDEKDNFERPKNSKPFLNTIRNKDEL